MTTERSSGEPPTQRTAKLLLAAQVDEDGIVNALVKWYKLTAAEAHDALIAAKEEEGSGPPVTADDQETHPPTSA